MAVPKLSFGKSSCTAAALISTLFDIPQREVYSEKIISINFWLLYHFFIFRSLCYTAIDFMTPIYYIVYSVASASDIDFLLMFYLVFLLPL